MSERRHSPSILFAVAAGPGLGFGHLVRAGVLADALGASRQLALRGPRTALYTALSRGWTVHQGAKLLVSLSPDLVIVDDPSPRELRRWIRLARQARIPIVAIRDGGSAVQGADLTVDGSLAARRADGPNRVAGPAFAILRLRSAARVASRDSRRALVALGGGSHVGRLGVAVARDLVRRRANLSVDLARGFALNRRTPRLPARCRWITAPDGLDKLFASAGVAVVAGGVTLHEACASGTPTVAVPAVGAQWPAIAAAASAGAVIGVPFEGRLTAKHAALSACAVLDTPGLAADLSRKARRLVDGEGTARVVARIRTLLGLSSHERWRHAA